MRFMMIVKASPASEAGAMPPEELIAAMGRYNEELTHAGALIDLNGLYPSSHGARVRFGGGQRTVTAGPFPETGELVAGYWIIQAPSLQDAVEWARRAPFCADAPEGEGAQIEIRALFEMGECTPSEAVACTNEVAERARG